MRKTNSPNQFKWAQTSPVQSCTLGMCVQEQATLYWPRRSEPEQHTHHAGGEPKTFYLNSDSVTLETDLSPLQGKKKHMGKWNL